MRIVVKIGTNLLTAKDCSLDEERIKALAKEFSGLIKQGNQLVIVTSGAIGAGMGKLGIKTRPDSLRDKQALAAVGQPILMDAYRENLGKLGHTVAQVLLTRQDFDDRQRYLNARSTLLALIEMNVIPVINENDTVAVEEINFGDNDTLAALVSAKISADLLIIMTDVDGLYKGVPGKSELISVVEEITPEIEGYASGSSSSGKGTGGMKTKIAAARIATLSGVKMVIADGKDLSVLSRAAQGEQIGTTFIPQKQLDSRKCWIAFGTKCRGSIIVDEGAADALSSKRKSLLPAGIVGVEGEFEVGDTVSVITREKKEIARGLTHYSSNDIQKIKGKKTSEIRNILARQDVEEIIHKDNLVIL